MEGLGESTPAKGFTASLVEDVSNLHDFPDISPATLSRNFVVELPNIEITSLDVTANGCFILAGCSNGMVVLFDMTSKDRNGTLAGQIRAKGMHTNLIVTVKFSQDCRFGFAGVIKGSMEMLAVDVGQIQVWHEAALQPPQGTLFTKTKRNSIVDANGLRHKTNAALLVRTYSHLDPKLRGFGAVSCLHQKSDEKYVLVCGKGIKNVHIWVFTPPQMSATKPFEPVSDPLWTCLYDVATNGVTIESLGFRLRSCSNDDGTVSTPKLEMLSKSSGMGIRVWDLSNLEQDASNNKIPYEDIANSNDCKAFCEEGTLSFGGTYDFSVMRLDAPKWANRESYEVPSRCNEDDNGERRRRMMRQIEQVLATQDGCHALALCTDGGVLYYHASADDTCLGPTEDIGEGACTSVDASSGCGVEGVISQCDADDGIQTKGSGGGDSGSPRSSRIGKRFGQIVEFQHLTREVELGPQFMTDNAWCLKRVGKRGVVILIRACQGVSGEDGEPRGVVLDVSILSELAPTEVGDTSLEDSATWSSWKYYHDDSTTIGWDIPKPSLDTEESMEVEGSGVMKGRNNRGRPPTGKPTKVKPLIGSTPRQDKGKQSDGSASKRQRLGYSTPVLGGVDASPGQAVGRRVDHISPLDNPLPPRAPKSSSSTHQARKTPDDRESAPIVSDAAVSADLGQVSKRLYTSYLSDESGRKVGKFDDVSVSDSEESEGEQPLRRLAIPPAGPPPLVKRTSFSDTVKPALPVHRFLEAVIVVTNKCHAAVNRDVFETITLDVTDNASHVKRHELTLIAEQRLLCEQFLNEVCRAMISAVSFYLEESDCNANASDIADIIRNVGDLKNKQYRVIVDEVLRRQCMELRAEKAKDVMLHSTGESILLSDVSDWKFFYPRIYAFTSACTFEFETMLVAL